MSNVDNEGLRTLEQARSGRPAPQYGTNQRLNPGELEEIEAAARRGAMMAPNETLALVNTITALTRRIAVRFNETAEAKQAVIALSERVASLEDAEGQMNYLRQEVKNAVLRAHRAESALEARGPMADLGHLRRLQQRVQELESHVEGEKREVRRLTRIIRTQLKDARTQITEYHRGAMERTKVVDKIRARFRIEPGEDLYDALCRKIGDLQTSEAELVSAPLMARAERAEARVEELEMQGLAGLVTLLGDDRDHRMHVPGDEADLQRILTQRQHRIEELERSVQDLFQKREAAEHRAARAARRIEEMENQGNQAVAAINERDQALETIASAVYGRRLDQAIKTSELLAGTATGDVIEVVRKVRAAMPAWLDGREKSGA